MLKKIMVFIFCTTFQLQAAESHNHKKRVDTVAELGQAIQKARKEVIKRPATAYVSQHRSAPRVEGDPEQRKKITEQK